MTGKDKDGVMCGTCFREHSNEAFDALTKELELYKGKYREWVPRVKFDALERQLADVKKEADKEVTKLMEIDASQTAEISLLEEQLEEEKDRNIDLSGQLRIWEKSDIAALKKKVEELEKKLKEWDEHECTD